jgi:hypothetical protein
MISARLNGLGNTARAPGRRRPGRFRSSAVLAPVPASWGHLQPHRQLRTIGSNAPTSVTQEPPPPRRLTMLRKINWGGTVRRPKRLRIFKERRQPFALIGRFLVHRVLGFLSIGGTRSEAYENLTWIIPPMRPFVRQKPDITPPKEATYEQPLSRRHLDRSP